MQDPMYSWNPQMQTMNMVGQYNMMAAMPEQQLENMYPNIYHIVHPAVCSYCDNLDMAYGSNYIPNKEQVEAITDNILKQVEPNVEAAIKKEASADERQFGFGGRRVLRGLVGILLIRELINRRRRPFGFYPGFPGYYPGYPYGGFY
jgi:hypothetical protein